MPELPEVESVKEGLNQTVAGSKISKVDVFWERIIADPKSIEEFKIRLQDQKIEIVKRRGKFLLFYLDEDVMISHLRMEGKYFVYKSGDPLEKHTHVVFHLEDGRELRYLDVRKFGRMSLVQKGEELSHASLAKLGPEPTETEFPADLLHPFLTKKSKAIKSVLLDQEMVVGIGNIYADEILYQSGIHPETPGNRLTLEQEKNLHRSIIDVLQRAVKAGGSTIRTYTNAFGSAGSYQDFLKVYGKENTPCPECGTSIEKIKVNGRGTHFCPSCQKEWREE